jgi:LPS export ABC transporter protein LptC
VITRLLSRYWLLIPLLLMAIVARDWVEAPADIEVEDTIDMRATQSDYYLEDFTTRSFNADGALAYELHGRSLAHYPDGDRSEIIAPEVMLHRPRVRWQIESARGQFIQKTGVFTLQGDVRIRRDPAGIANLARRSVEAEPVEIRTSELSVFTATNDVHTDQPVEIIAESWQLRSVGLQSSIDAGKLQLLSRVQGHYESQYE